MDGRFGESTVLFHGECFYGHFPLIHRPSFCNCLGEAVF